MAQKIIGNPMDDSALNSTNHNFTELYKGKQDLDKRIDYIVDEVSGQAFDKVIDSASLNWDEMVEKKNDLPNTAEKGTAIAVKEQGIVYRYDGSEWVGIYEINLNPIAEVDQRISAQLKEKVPNKKVFSTTQNRWWSEDIESVSVEFGDEDIVVPVRPRKPKQTIVFIGSSTTEGTGTSDRPNKNYMQVLADKLSANDYSFHNRGIGGNNTQDVIERFYIDVAPLNPDFVFIALTIGNEGIYTNEDKKVVYQRFKGNMLKIIRMVQQIGAIPIIANQTPTQRYNEEIYKMAKQLNAELEAMGVFCVDWMGALDDLTGQPVTEGVYDRQHYNDLGHIELANAIPPSIFKRISLQDTGNLQSGNGSIFTGDLATESPLYFLPEYDITTFTTSIKFKVSEIALSSVLSFGSGNRVALLANGNLGVYFPSLSSTLGKVEEGEWYTLAVSFNNLSKELRFYLNGELKHTMNSSSFQLEYLYVAGRPTSNAPLRNAYIKDFLVYRSRLTDEQIKQIHKGIYSQTSLELFSPLCDRNIYAGGSLINVAPTTSSLNVNPEETGISF